MASTEQAYFILTANHLTGGNVVYWANNGWTVTFADGEIFASETAAAPALEAAKAAVTANQVVNPYLFATRLENGIPVPVKERERIRANGPSILYARGTDHVSL